MSDHTEQRPFTTMGPLMAAAADSDHVPASQRSRLTASSDAAQPSELAIDVDAGRQAAVLAAMRTNPHLATMMRKLGLKASDVVAHGPRGFSVTPNLRELIADTQAREASEKKVGR